MLKHCLDFGHGLKAKLLESQDISQKTSDVGSNPSLNCESSWLSFLPRQSVDPGVCATLKCVDSAAVSFVFFCTRLKN